MWSPSRPKILAFKYRLTQVGKKGNFLRIKSDFIVPLSHGKIHSPPTWSLEGEPSSGGSEFPAGALPVPVGTM